MTDWKKNSEAHREARHGDSCIQDLGWWYYTSGDLTPIKDVLLSRTTKSKPTFDVYPDNFNPDHYDALALLTTFSSFYAVKYDEFEFTAAERDIVDSFVLDEMLTLPIDLVGEPKNKIFCDPAEMKLLHQRVQTTTVYVTHDQVEAMTLADRIVIMNEGRIEQVGTPDEVYKQPASQFVASFIGSPAMNFVTGVISKAEGAVKDLCLCIGQQRIGRNFADAIVSRPVFDHRHHRGGGAAVAMRRINGDALEEQHAQAFAAIREQPDCGLGGADHPVFFVHRHPGHQAWSQIAEIAPS